MQRSDIPAKFNIPFANGAGGSFITNPIPEPSQIGIADGRASLTTGFPPLNFLPTGAGGIPPYGSDFNGILFGATSWDRWFSAGGPVQYDSAFSAAVGGYAEGALVESATTIGVFWLSTADNNTTDPDAGGAGWLSMTVGAKAHGQCYFQRTNTTQATLVPRGGSGIVVNGITRLIPAAGITLDITNCYVNGVAAEALAASTVYNAYLRADGNIDCRTGANSGHIASTTTGNVGVEVRSVGGTPDDTLTLIGKVATNGSTQLGAQGVGVISWFNRRNTIVAVEDAVTIQNYNVTVFTSLPAATRVTFLAWGDESVECICELGSVTASAATYISLLVALDGVSINASSQFSPFIPSAARAASPTTVRSTTPSEGQHIVAGQVLINTPDATAQGAGVYTSVALNG